MKTVPFYGHRKYKKYPEKSKKNVSPVAKKYFLLS